MAVALGSWALLTSCSKFSRLSKDGFTRVTIGSDPGRLVGPRTASTPGGVMVWAVSASANLKYSFTLSSETATWAAGFPNGTWDFYAAHWIGGTGSLQNTIRCGHTQAILNGSDTGISIPVAQDCSDAFFGPAIFKDGTSVPYPLRILTCLGVASGVNADSTCSSDVGDLNSFQVSMVADPNFTARGVYPAGAQRLTTNCISLPSSSVMDTYLKLPVGKADGSSPIHTEIVGYTSSNCSGGAAVTYSYHRGLIMGEDTYGKGVVFSARTNNVNAVFIPHGALPAPSITGLSQATGGWGGGYDLQVNGTDLRSYPDRPATVTVNGVSCPVTSASGAFAYVKCTVPNMTNPANLGTPYDVLFTQGDGQTSNYSSSFQYNDDGMGNAADGSLAVTTPMSTTDTLSNGRVFSANRNVTNISGAPNVSTFTVSSFTSSEFQVGDEVIWHITASSGSSACTSGGTTTTGTFGYARITGVTSTTMTIDKNLPNMDGSPYSPNNVNIAASTRTNGSTFCVIQVARVPNLSSVNITASSSDVSISPPAFSFASGKGGLLAARITGNLTVNRSSSYVAGFSSSGKGFQGGAPTYQGDSGTGSGVVSQLAGDAGGGAGGSGAPNKGGGGGAHEAGGGTGGNNASSNGAFTTTGCVPGTASPTGCAQMGGGGGAGLTANGGNGGGVTLLYARYLATSTSAPFRVDASGTSATSEADAGGGGGAGGTAFLQTRGDDTQTIALNSAGANGAAATGASAGGGGGGGGGTAQIRHCSGTPTTPTITWGNIEGAGGSATTAGTAGSAGYTSGDNANRDTSVTSSMEFCY